MEEGGLVTSPTVAEFYAAAHRGTAFGVRDAAHSSARGHSGTDFNGWARYTRIPSFVAGKVAGRGSDPGNFGNWVSLAIGGGEYVAFCHMDSWSGVPEVGADVPFGGDVGPLGSTGYSEGNHVHVMLLTSPDPRTYRGIKDPMPLVLAALRGGGGGGGGTSNGANMEKILRINSTDGKTVKKGEHFYHRDGVTPIVPLTGDSSKGGVYWLNTVCGVAIFDIGGKTFETYRDDQQKRVLTSSALFTLEQVATTVGNAIDSAFEDVEIPTPSISAADRKAIAEAAGAAAVKQLGSAIANG